MKYIKFLALAMILAFMSMSFSGCDDEPKIVYVDSNGTVITPKPKYERLNAKIVCDKYGYAYYLIKHKSINGYESLAPVLYNKTYGTYIFKCSEL
jgi:hypothetical protein